MTFRVSENGILSPLVVLDAFVRHKRFGFVFLLEVPSEYPSYSIVHEYPTGVFGANFQTWNLNYFGFYEKFVLFHKRHVVAPGDDANKHVIVIENMDNNNMRKFISFKFFRMFTHNF